MDSKVLIQIKPCLKIDMDSKVLIQIKLCPGLIWIVKY